MARSFSSESAFMDGVTDMRGIDGEDIRLTHMDGDALRSGVLEKATKDASAWKPRMCTLRAEAFWYSKDVEPDAKGGKDSQASRNKWTCIPLSTCVQLLRWPDDGRVFLVQTESRSYYWRAKSQNEAEAWLLSIGTQRANMKEGELLREGESRITRTEEAYTGACLEFLHSLYRLEGTLRFHDTRELLSSFLVDFFRARSNSSPEYSASQQVVTKRCGRSQLPNECQKADEQPGHDATPSGAFVTSRTVITCGPSGFTLEEAHNFLKLWASGEPEHLSNRSEFAGPASSLRGVRVDAGIGEWLRVEVFPQFISSPIIQRRVAQLAASRSVVNWGIDPLKSPLLTPNIFDGGFQQPSLSGGCGPDRSPALFSLGYQYFPWQKSKLT
ncbi:hypothetical protein Esti_005107 [Eimeria stiedai]